MNFGADAPLCTGFYQRDLVSAAPALVVEPDTKRAVSACWECEADEAGLLQCYGEHEHAAGFEVMHFIECPGRFRKCFPASRCSVKNSVKVCISPGTETEQGRFAVLLASGKATAKCGEPYAMPSEMRGQPCASLVGASGSFVNWTLPTSTWAACL